MRLAVLCCCLIISITTFGQVDYYNPDQLFAPQVLKDNKIKKIEAYEYPYSKSGQYADGKGALQSVSLFNPQGRIIKKSYYWVHSDIGNIAHIFKYDQFGRITSKSESVNKEVQTKELFEYDSIGNISSWKVTFPEAPDNSFEKYFEYDEKGNPIKQTLKLNRDKRIDNIKNTYSDDGTIQYKVIEIDSSSKNDSTAYVFAKGDTIWREEVYQQGKLAYTLAKLKRVNNTTYRLVNYSDGELVSIKYNTYNQRGSIVLQKNFHTLPQYNYKKVYEYNRRGEPYQKTVYESGVDPVMVIRYKVDYYY